jgi:hypothetical protein
MKALLIYWIIGCVLMGLVFGKMLQKCPSDPVDYAELVATVAVWPLLVVGVVSLPASFIIPEAQCKRPAA